MRGCLVGSGRGRSKRLALMVQITKQSRRIKIHALMLTVLVHGTAIEKRRIVARNGRKIRASAHMTRWSQPGGPAGRPHIIGIWLDLFSRSRGCQPQQFLYSKSWGFLGGQGRPLGAVARGLGSRGRGRSSRSLDQAWALNSVMIQIRIWSPIIGCTADHPRRVVSTVNHALVSFGFFWCSLRFGVSGPING